jgi:hypothetical protein
VTDAGNVLNRGIQLRELRNIKVQMAMIEALNDLTVNNLVHPSQVGFEGVLAITLRNRDRHLKAIVVAVTIAIIALPEQSPVFLFAEVRAVMSVRGGERVLLRDQEAIHVRKLQSECEEGGQPPAEPADIRILGIGDLTCDLTKDLAMGWRRKLFRGRLNDRDGDSADDLIQSGDIHNVSRPRVRGTFATDFDFVERTESSHALAPGMRAAERRPQST